MITGIILASGFSRRMKRDKLTMEIKDIPMVERVIMACKASKLDEIILVYRTEEVREIGIRNGIKTVYNPKAYLGQSEGMKLGIKAAKDNNALMFLVGDQPFINHKLIDKLMETHLENEYSIIVPYYNGKQGMPTIFPFIYKRELMNIDGDKGGRDIINREEGNVKRVYLKDEKLGMDIDNMEEFKLIN